MSTSLPSWARVGVKVVFVGKVFSNYGLRGLELGAVYTIRDAYQNVDGRCGIHLVEVVNEPVRTKEHGNAERFYMLRSFRPLVTIEDDIATHFSQHLTTRQPRTVEAVE